MTRHSLKNESARFFAGLLISSVGGMTFVIGLIVFMMKAGFSLFQVSLIIGLSRLVPVTVSTLLGDVADRVSARKMVLITELIAGLTSIGIFFAWRGNTLVYPAILILCVIRATILAFQSGSRNKLVKELSGAGYESNSKNTVYYNKATQGATLFAGLLAWFAFKYINFESVIAFDGITFFVNGLLLLTISSATASVPAKPLTNGLSIVKKFKDLYTYNPRTARLDVFVALAMMGTASFNTRLAGAEQQWNPIFLISYGLAVWVAGWLVRSKATSNLGASLWFGFGVSYAALGGFSPGWALIGVSFIKDTFYWILYHRITTAIQMDTPPEIIGSVSHARNAQVIAILAMGELAVGAWQSVLPLGADALWRGLLCCAVGISLSLGESPVKMGCGYERPLV
ncbi:hypothetical protein WDW37_18940 [Bdellovibrionota bacterium FG-1]